MSARANYDAVKSPLGEMMPTRALEENLRRTAVDVVIPPQQLLLLEITAPMYGIRRNTEQLLREIHHAFPGWAQTLADLHRHALGDFYYYNTSDRGPDALRIFSDLYEKVGREGDDVAVRHDALRFWVRYVEKVVDDSGSRLGANLGAIEYAVGRITAMVAASPEAALVVSGGVRRLAGKLLGLAGDARTATLRLLVAVLDRVYATWQAQDDPVGWLPASVDPAVVEPISTATIRRLRRDLGSIDVGGDIDDDTAGSILSFPDHGEISRNYIAAADAVAAAADDRHRSLMDRASWLCRVVGHELLVPMHETAVRMISRDCGEVVAGASDDELSDYLGRVFAGLRSDEGRSMGRAQLGLAQTIGVAVLEARNPRRSRMVIDHLLALDFEYPEFAGFTDEWGVRVNPNHLANIRTYLRVIEVDPQMAERLLEALVVHLEIGGVFMADTDLFQKDVSRLLAAPIEPVYQQTKQLLRLFPVYFNDIGAEGEMRTVSTRLDEIRGRLDPLVHFLRKQSHVESNPQLVSFIENVGRFWATGDPSPLRQFVPEELYRRLDIDDENYRGLHRVFQKLVDSVGGIVGVFELPVDTVLGKLAAITGESSIDIEKARLLIRVRHEVARKYELDHAHLIERLIAYNRLDAGLIASLQEALDAGDTEAALGRLLDILEDLQERILDPAPTEAFEDIYLKRHIAAGIPSMYGRYREEKLEAVGLTFRVESMAGALFDRMAADEDWTNFTHDKVLQLSRWLHLLERGLRADGCGSESLVSVLAMLDDAAGRRMTSTQQLINILQLISRNVQHIVRTRYMDVYLDMVDNLAGRMIERGVLTIDARDTDQEALLKFGETFLRDLIADSMALPSLDRLVGKVMQALSTPRGSGAVFAPEAVATDDHERWFVPIDGDNASARGILALGNKGFMLTTLAEKGFPVPPGFVLTTDLSRARRARDGGLPPAVIDRIRREVKRIELDVGARFGDPHRPLLLSVRGGAAISMPGMLDSFLNVGMNPEIAEGVAADRRPWTAWDSYRRFIQFWGMSNGIDRDLFDSLILAAKQRHSVALKALLPARAMRDLALEYRTLLLDNGVAVVDDPFEQLLGCVGLALDSWDSSMAHIYRGEMQIAEEWGTAVIIQHMVYGNLHHRSGTGVVQTRQPPPDDGSFELYGDFVIQGQGDDVVSGLVATFPITEAQRIAEVQDRSVSLEKDFPQTYAELHRLATRLIDDYGFPFQEIEFTFESDHPDDLYILQSREAVQFDSARIDAFVGSAMLEASRVAHGIGVGGGAFSGRLALSAADIDRLKQEHSGDPILLVRPDTVPDDIGLLLQSDGLLTAVGGATSHAAVVARRLGRPCVVGCRQLHVFESEDRVEIGGRELRAGDFLSISGMDGSVYVGQHAVKSQPVRGLAR